jgi:Cu/Ag efflux protein CusF
MKSIKSLLLAVALALPQAVHAADQAPLKPGAMKHEGMGQSSMDAGKAASGMSQGEIRKVDKTGKKITIKHGPLANLDMPGMTMTFKVADPAMLDQVKADDKVNFVAEKINGALTVTKIEAAK